MTGEKLNKESEYKRSLRALQIELVKLQRLLIENTARTLVIIEGRDTAGKDGMIKRLTAHMSPRETRVFAPPKPSDRESSEWYFQRFLRQLPAGGEFVIFNRSWYNRAGVERVMGFCTEKDVAQFFDTVNDLESMLVRSGIAIRKYYLDISKIEQKQRLTARETDPLKRWKNSPVDAAAVKNWDAYTKARDDMFRRTSHKHAPWHVVHSDHKKRARLALLSHLLESFDYPGKHVPAPDKKVVFAWSPKAGKKGLLAS